MRLSTLTALLAGLLLIGGCVIDGEAKPAGGAPEKSSSVRDLIGQWQGTYRCAQGETSLTLDITPASEPGSDLPRARAVFTFGPVSSNPGVPHGSYSMVVTNDSGNTFRFTQQKWINQPTTYVMVDLVGQLVGSRLSGSVVGDGCSTFRVTRA